MHRNKLIALLIALMLCWPMAALAQEKFDYTVFKQLPVIHEGRVKPLGRMAQLFLSRISDIPVSTDEAAPWLAQILFDPQSADAPAIFYIADRNIRYVLHLPKREAPYYSFAELNKAFSTQADLILDLRQRDAKTLNQQQQDLLTLYGQVTYYEQLKGAMTLLLPLKSAKAKTFLDLQDKDAKLAKLLLAQGQNNQSLRLIPAGQDWQTPWEALLNKGDQKLLRLWAKTAQAYIHGKPEAWQKNTRALYTRTISQSEQPSLSLQLKTELLYTAIDPYFYSLACYAAGLILALFMGNRAKPVIWLAFLSGLALHGFGLLCRMIILQRPPVSNLYESVLFVSFLIMSLGLGFIWRRKDRTLLLPLALLGIGLHLLGFSLNGEDDNLKVLQAVLDTKFWLATHVIIITSGYAFCLLTSVVAHVCLYQNNQHMARTKSFRMAYLLSLASLLLVSIGTLLGGVWADQSWGRFWGWDPKENGALLIALWLVWLLHGKFSRDIGEFWFMIGLAALSLVVSLSWIGVNLLGIGLHSYGFISGSAISLLVIFAFEAAFFLWCRARRKIHARP